MYLKIIAFLGLVFVVPSCTIPQPRLTPAERELVRGLESECHCKVERSYSALRSRKGDYVLAFTGPNLEAFHPYIETNGPVIARNVYKDILKFDTDISSIQLLVCDSIGEDLFRYKLFEYKVDSLR